MEDKEGIVRALSFALMQTRAGRDIAWMCYRKDADNEEYVDIYYSAKHVKHVCVTADSGIALIQDVLKHIS